MAWIELHIKRKCREVFGVIGRRKDAVLLSALEHSIN